VASSVFVLNLHFRGHKYSPVPDWIKKILFIKTTEDIGINLIKIKNLKKGFRSTALHKPTTLSLNALESYYDFDNRRKSSVFETNRIVINNVSNDLKDKIHAITKKNVNSSQALTTKRTSSKSKNVSGNSIKLTSDQLQLNSNIEKILKITKLSSELFERNYVKKVFKQIISDEWKYVAARFDLLLFIFAVFIVVGTPIMLFGKYARRDFYKDLSCGCND
jgi:hypothetical protein